MNKSFHYKSWPDLNKKLTNCLCQELNKRISYFVTFYHEVHNAYGRASINLDGNEVTSFTWNVEYSKESQNNVEKDVYSEGDFLNAAINFLQMNIKEALKSNNDIIKVFAILDKRVGKRTLERLLNLKEYLLYPNWLKYFYELRFKVTLNK